MRVKLLNIIIPWDFFKYVQMKQLFELPHATPPMAPINSLYWVSTHPTFNNGNTYSILGHIYKPPTTGEIHQHSGAITKPTFFHPTPGPIPSERHLNRRDIWGCWGHQLRPTMGGIRRFMTTNRRYRNYDVYIYMNIIG